MLELKKEQEVMQVMTHSLSLQTMLNFYLDADFSLLNLQHSCKMSFLNYTYSSVPDKNWFAYLDGKKVWFVHNNC